MIVLRGSRRRAAGFTLLEIVLVIGLIVILSALVLPNFMTQQTAAQLGDSAESLRVGLRMARATAMTTGRRVRVRWEPEQQQPILEFEKDATREPGKWEPCTESWAEGVTLRGDVNCISVTRGRPEFLTPISHGDSEVIESSEDAGGSFGEKSDDSGDAGESEGDVEQEEEPASSELSSEANKQPEDPDRLTVEFDIDGSSDWHLLKLARLPLGDPVEEDTRQIWIVLDGRNGLARIQDPLSEDQLADISLRPNLDLLQPPEKSIEDLSFTAPLDELAGLAGAAGAAAGGQPPADDAGVGLSGAPESLEDAAAALPEGAGEAVSDAIDDMAGTEEMADDGSQVESGQQDANDDASTSGGKPGRKGGKMGV